MKRAIAIATVGFVISACVAYQAAPSLSDPSIDAVLSDLIHLRQAMDERVKQGLKAPDDAIGLNVLLEPPAKLGKLSKDQWGSDYLYKRSGAGPGYTIYSAGKNRIDERGGGDDVTDRTKFYSCQNYGVGCPPRLDEIVFIAANVLALISLLVAIVLSGVWAVRRTRVRRAA